MITLRVWFVMIMLATMLTGRTVWTALITSPEALSRLHASTTIGDIADPLKEQSIPRIDVYGNEIEDAVGDYRIDTLGDVYERHSPDTEVPRLSPPVI